MPDCYIGDPFFNPVCMPAAITLQNAFVYFIERNLSMSKTQLRLLGQAGGAYQVVKGFKFHGGTLPDRAGIADLKFNKAFLIAQNKALK
jgi:hypothetical protein